MVVINGEEKDVAGKTVLQYLAEAGFDTANVVVERNLEILARECLGDVVLQDGDSVEVLRFVGGG